VCHSDALIILSIEYAILGTNELFRCLQIERGTINFTSLETLQGRIECIDRSGSLEINYQFTLMRDELTEPMYYRTIAILIFRDANRNGIARSELNPSIYLLFNSQKNNAWFNH
jgi:hypothetical protein